MTTRQIKSMEGELLAPFRILPYGVLIDGKDDLRGLLLDVACGPPQPP